MNISRGLAAALLIVALPAIAAAHHGSAISYDTAHQWTTWATVTEFTYKNPHPSMTFDRTLKNGKVEHWTAEMLLAPAPLARAGWTRARSEEALKPGTRVKLYLATARAGGTSAIVMHLENEAGESIVAMIGGRPPAEAPVDMDGVPMGLQPTGPDKLVPGREGAGQ